MMVPMKAATAATIKAKYMKNIIVFIIIVITEPIIEVTANHLGLFFLFRETIPKIKEVGRTKKAMNPMNGMREVAIPVASRMKAQMPVRLEFHTVCV